jgi:hypothetical protein
MKILRKMLTNKDKETGHFIEKGACLPQPLRPTMV